MTGMPGTSWSGPLPPLDEEEQEVGNQLRAHILALAGEIGERNVWRKSAMEKAAAYIENAFGEAGYAVRSQPFQSQGVMVRNLAAELPASSGGEEIVLLGAHYDTVVDSPGANDNASGIAALLEIARLLRDRKPSRSIRFVAFANEEAPFFYSMEMGSHLYARRAREQGEKLIAMISLETVGYYSDAPGSQRFPNPLYSWFYPDTGNFIAFVGNLRSRKLVRRSIGSFRRHTAFPSEGVAAPGGLEGIHWSDHWSFWEEGYPALMVTDTAPFIYPHYHRESDTPEKIDYERLARVVRGLSRVALDLAEDGS